MTTTNPAAATAPSAKRAARPAPAPQETVPPQDPSTGTPRPDAVPAATRTRTAAKQDHRVSILIPTDSAGVVIIDGTAHETQAGDLQELREAAAQLVYDRIVLPGKAPVVLNVEDVMGSARMVLNLDGTLEVYPDLPPSAPRSDNDLQGQAPAAQGREGQTAAEEPAGQSTAAATVASARMPQRSASHVQHPWTGSPVASTSTPAAPPTSGSSAANPFLPSPPASSEDPWVSKPISRSAAPHATAAPNAPASPEPLAPSMPAEHTPQTRPRDSVPASRPSPTLQDLLTEHHQLPEPSAALGWRAMVATLSGGLLRLPPGPAEVRHREYVRQVHRPLATPKTIVIGNPKGGASKTTSTLLLAAQYGLHRGASVLAWDNNETRGTLGWAAHPGPTTASTIDLLADLLLREGGHPDRARTICEHVCDPATANRLRAALQALNPGQPLPADGHRRALSVGDLARYVRPQAWGHFHVLASPEVNHSTEESADLVSRDGFTALHRALSDLYEILLIDTGNNIGAANWRAAVDHADQLVVVSTLRWDSIRSASDMLDALRKRGKTQLIERAITVLVEPSDSVDRDLREQAHSHFNARTHQVAFVPHDHALVPGGTINYNALSARTKEAWLQVAAASAAAL